LDERSGCSGEAARCMNKKFMILHDASLTCFLNDLFCVIQELQANDAQSEEQRKKMRSKAKGEAARKSRQAPKNPRKDNKKKANNAESVAETISTSSTTSAMEIGTPGTIIFFFFFSKCFGFLFRFFVYICFIC
jgi:hypothetical protein